MTSRCDQEGVYERAVDAIKLAKSKGFRVSINCTLFDGADPDRVAAFFDTIADLNIDGVMTSPGYAYERAPDQEHFLNRTRTKELFRDDFPPWRREQEARQGLEVQPEPALPGLPGRQPDLCLHALGQPDAQRVRLAAPLLPAG